MQPLNNDMDHLMRQAADAFEVPPTGADWQKVAAALDRGDVIQKDSSVWVHSIRLGLLLLFLMTSLVCNKYLFLPFGQFSGQLKSVNETVQNSDVEKGNEVTKTVSNSIVKTKNIVSEKEVTSPPDIINQNVSFSFYKSGAEKSISNQMDERIEVIQPDEKFVKQEVAGVKSSSISQPNLEKLKTSIIPFVNTAPLIPDAAIATEKKREPERKSRRFYLGAVAGPDISTVKFEESSDVGFSAGVVGGYNLTKKWALETGLLWNRKNYYSQGKHFNTSKLKLPSHTNIIYAEGYCNMFEIPINVRYQFAHGKKHHWFAAAGSSSYLMQKEDYHYLYERYNVHYYNNKSYRSASKNWFAVANISAGYVFEKTNGINIRIEPYLKLPIKGMGVGSLPITSTGIQVGITYPVH